MGFVSALNSSSFAYLLFQMPKSTMSAKPWAAKSGMCENLPWAVSCGSALNTALQSNQWAVFLWTWPSKPRLELTGVASLRLSADDAGYIRASAKSRTSVQRRLWKPERKEGREARGEMTTLRRRFSSRAQHELLEKSIQYSVRHFYLLCFSFQLI